MRRTIGVAAKVSSSSGNGASTMRRPMLSRISRRRGLLTGRTKTVLDTVSSRTTPAFKSVSTTLSVVVGLTVSLRDFCCFGGDGICCAVVDRCFCVAWKYLWPLVHCEKSTERSLGRNPVWVRTEVKIAKVDAILLQYPRLNSSQATTTSQQGERFPDQTERHNLV
jgi:hypothetical protein